MFLTIYSKLGRVCFFYQWTKRFCFIKSYKQNDILSKEFSLNG